MTSFKSSARFFSLALALLFLLVPGLGSVLADDPAPQPSEKPQAGQPAADNHAAAIETVEPAEPSCAPDLGLPELAPDRTSPRLSSAVPLCPVADPLEDLFSVRMGPPRKPRFCSCSCGLPCETDADCGGGSVCIVGITCC